MALPPPPSSASPLSLLDAHPLLWRGKQLSHGVDTISTGHKALDAALPGHGWPANAVTEIITSTVGCGEFSLLLPALAALSQKNQWIIMLDPPWIPYPSALQGRGLAVEKILLVRTRNKKESLWACEQVLRDIPGGAMLAWPGALSFGELRRLQLAAKNGQQSAFLFRKREAADSASPAALRLQLTVDNDDLSVSVLKCRGQRPGAAIRIRRSLLFQPLIPPRVSSSGSSKRSRSSSERPVVSLATSRIGRPSL